MERPKLARLFWDYDVSEQELQKRLEKNDPCDPLTVSLYNRILLSTPNWYDILRLLSQEQLKTALSNQVLSTIHSPALRKRYHFARGRLFPGS